MSTIDPAELPEVFPPTLREVLVRPRWLTMLALCLVVAGVFAWLGQWQLGVALQRAPVAPGQSEQVMPIDDVVKPGEYLNAPLVGQKAEITGQFVAGDFLVVAERINDGVLGYWVTGQLRRADSSAAAGATAGQPTSLAVAVGWAPTAEKANAAADALNAAPPQHLKVVGRVISDEGPKLPPRADPTQMTTMSPAALLGRWHDIADLNVYRPYMVSNTAMGGLDAIDSHPPQQDSGVNLLNLFYALEWAVFAGFAFYLWYRLGKDAWEKECEEMADAAGSDGTGSDGTGSDGAGSDGGGSGHPGPQVG